MTVELDVYSGRPNPTWTLTAEEITTLAARLNGLPLSDSPPPESGLGYRGFLITNPERAGGLPPRIRVAGGVVMVERDGPLQIYQDAHGIERWLLRQASQRGYGALVDAVSPPQGREE
jgi:hypothetical protein